MNEKWEYVKLKDVADVLDPHPSHRAPKAVEEGIAFAGIGDIDEFGNVDYRKARVVSPDVLEEQKASYDLNQNSIGYGRVGTVGKIIYFGTSERNFTLSPTMAVINPKGNIVAEFLKAYLPTYDFWAQVNAKMTGTTRPSVGIQQMREMLVPLPDKKIQIYIGQIWKAITDKIETNIKINRNLQEQADTIYTDMFVNSTEGIDRSGRLAELINVKYGKDHKKLADGLIPVYGSGGIMRYVERPLYTEESVLIPRKGSLNNVMYVNEPFWSVDTMFYTEMKVSNVAKFVYHFMKCKDLASMNAGSAVPSMTTDILNAMEVAIPSADKLREFEELVSPLYAMIKANMVQSIRLANLRDSLLPRLMSGELDVSDLDI